MTSERVVVVLAFALGLAIAVATAISLIRTLVIPRALPSFITTATSRAVNGIFWAVALLRRTYEGRDAVLAWAGPLSILVTLVVWLLLFLLGYGLMLYGISPLSLGDSFRQAGSSLFTLGFAGSITPDQTLVDFVAAGTGPVVIALLIGFLPNLYSTYTAREVEMTLLATRAGEPAWGPELLSRVALDGSLDELPDMWRQWERWAATVRLTQTTYPVLNRMRSARPSRHWVIALLTVMDAAALQLALTRTLPRTEALGLIVQGATTLEVLYAADHTFGDPELRARRRAHRRGGRQVHDPEAQAALPRAQRSANPTLSAEVAAQTAAAVDQEHSVPARLLARSRHQLAESISLSRNDFDQALELLRRSGFPLERDPDAAWTAFVQLRREYEEAAYGLAHHLYATPAPWSGDRRPPIPVEYPAHAVDIAHLLGDDPTEPSEAAP